MGGSDQDREASVRGAHYGQMARELRARALQAMTAEARLEMERLAVLYEKLAATLGYQDPEAPIADDPT